MRRPALLGASLAAVLLLLVAVGATNANATGPDATPAVVEIQTVPPLANVRFSLAGKVFASDQNGYASIQLEDTGTYEMEILDAKFEGPGIQAEFSRWADNSYTAKRELKVRRATKVQAGFDIYYPVTMHFVDRSGNPVDPDRVTSVTLTNSLGRRETFNTWEPKWLLTSRVARRSSILGVVETRYLVESVIVDGTNVVNRSQLRFFPSQTQDVPIQLLFYSARFRARDAFFGFPLGSSIELVYPDGLTEQHDFDSNSEVVLDSLPRGDYKVKVKAAGLSFTRPVSLSRDQEVELQVISYIDLGLTAIVLWIIVTGLLWIGRPHLFGPLHRLLRRLRAKPQPTPQEIEW